MRNLNFNLLLSPTIDVLFLWQTGKVSGKDVGRSGTLLPTMLKGNAVWVLSPHIDNFFLSLFFPRSFDSVP